MGPPPYQARLRCVFLSILFLLLFLPGCAKLQPSPPAPAPPPSPQSQPPQSPESKYPYYTIYNEETGEVLTTVSSVPVSVGDEWLAADNKRYEVVRVEGDRAYARRK